MENTYTIETLLLCDAAYNNRYGPTPHSRIRNRNTKYLFSSDGHPAVAAVS